MVSLWQDTHPIRPTVPAAEPRGPVDTLIVGAGLTGLSTALMLARAGQRVLVVEAREVGAVTTGASTAKLSLLQGLTLSRLRRHHPDEVLRAHVTGLIAGQDWLRTLLTDRGVDHQVRTACSYTCSLPGLRLLEEELEACQAAGLPADWSHSQELPFPISGAIELAGQVQFNPLEVLDALLTEFLDRGGRLCTGNRVHEVDTGRVCTVSGPGGRWQAERVVLASGVPFLDRGGHFARLQAVRSYLTACRVPGVLPRGMYLSVDEPIRSLRTAPGPDGEVLLIGGNGHPVGRQPSTRAQLADLQAWGAEHFPGARFSHAWSAQDYRPVTALPQVGELAFSHGRVLAATGYDKWGMNNAVSAALRMSGRILDQPVDWAADLEDVHGAAPADLEATLSYGVEAGAALVAGWSRVGLHPLPAEPPEEGTGQVGRRGVRPLARSTVRGHTCTVSARCTHLGGVLTWNDAEQSWDCPLHGSRFTAGGRLLEGPAVEDLEVVSDPG